MASLRVHRQWGKKFANELGLDPSWSEKVDFLIDNPRHVIEIFRDKFENPSTIQCLEDRGVDVKILAALKLGLISHDWHTQMLSPERIHTSIAWIKLLKEVVNCIIGLGASYLAELHIALDLISKMKSLNPREILKELKLRNLSNEVLRFITKNIKSIISSINIDEKSKLYSHQALS